jgi:hypothetical protein
MIDCVFSGKLKRGLFNGTIPEFHRKDLGRTHNEFRGNDFREMELIDVGFRTGIDLTQQILPKGPQYLYLHDAEILITELRQEVIKWSDLEARQKALVIVKYLEVELAGGQKNLFVRRNTFPRSHRKMANYIFDILDKRGNY